LTKPNPHGDGSEFRRALGPWSAGALVAGSMIGTGIFLFVSDVAAQLPGAGFIMLAWALGAVIAGCGGLCLAELAAAYPSTGGIYVYLDRAFGPLVAFLYAWCKFLIMRVGSFAIPALFFAGFFTDLLDFAPAAAEAWRVPVALALIAVLTIVNAMGVRAGGGVQNVLTAIKIATLVAIVGVGAAYLAGWRSAHPVEGIVSAPIAEGPWWLLLGTALIPVLWTYGGWDESPFVAEEVIAPQRNLPRSILGGLAVCAVLFIVVNGAYLAILTPGEMAASEGRTAIWAMGRALGPWAGAALCVALMVSTFGAANGMALTGARIGFAAGRDQAVFHWLARTSRRTRVPLRALVVQAILAGAAIVLMNDPFTLLLYTGVAYWCFAGLMALAVFVLRRRDAERPRPFRTWGYPVTPGLFIAAATCMAVSAGRQEPRNAMATAVILGVGIVVFVLQRSASGDSIPQREDAR
jgi:amino acid transporter